MPLLRWWSWGQLYRTTGRALAHSDKPCQGPRLRGMAVNTPSHKSPYNLKGTLSGTFFLRCGRGERCTEPQFGLPPTAESCQGPRLRGMAVNTPSHKSPYCLRGTLSVTFFCVGGRGERCTEPQFGLPPTAESCQGPRLRGMAVNTPSHAFRIIRIKHTYPFRPLV